MYLKYGLGLHYIHSPGNMLHMWLRLPGPNSMLQTYMFDNHSMLSSCNKGNS